MLHCNSCKQCVEAEFFDHLWSAWMPSHNWLGEMSLPAALYQYYDQQCGAQCGINTDTYNSYLYDLFASYMK